MWPRGAMLMRRALAVRAVLPRLPLPALSDTIARYTAAVEPLCDERDAKHSVGLLSDFAAKDGEGLQRDLAEIAAFPRESYPGSFVEKYWDDMYLEGRWALPINSNPALMIKSRETRSQARSAAALILSSARFARRALTGELSQTPGPLDMRQYSRMFCSSRIPLRGRDKIALSADIPADQQHAVVLRGDRAYRIRVLDKDGATVTEAGLRSALEKLLSEPVSCDPSRLVSSLTSLERDTWASVRADLEQIPVNRATLSAIDSALFVVVLDASSPCDAAAASSHALHGASGALDPRWFDKSMQLLVAPDGQFGVNFEHSWGDGACVGRFVQEVVSDMDGVPSGFPPLSDPAAFSDAALEPLRWDLSDAIRARISDASRALVASADGMESAVLQFDRFGKDFSKKNKMSPDALVQMAFQLAAWQQSGRVLPTYESCNMQHFHCGRTDAIRSASGDAKSMAQGWARADNAQRRALLSAATARQEQLTKETREGKGFDRHLYALRFRAKETGRAEHEFFSSTAYQTLNSNLLSTSTVSLPSLRLAGFGPVHADGFGVAYAIHNNELAFNITSFRKGTAVQFADALEKALSDIENMF